jgi:hypothetical protein
MVIMSSFRKKTLTLQTESENRFFSRFAMRLRECCRRRVKWIRPRINNMIEETKMGETNGTAATPKGQGRIGFVDYIRVVACLMVMVVHASENFYVHHDDMSLVANESNRFWVAFYDGALGRISVPLFMIVSAFLLVPMRQGQTMSQFYRRRFMRILPPSFVFFAFALPLSTIHGALRYAGLRCWCCLAPYTAASYELSSSLTSPTIRSK